MIKKNNFRILTLSLGILLILLSTNVIARQIGEFSEFKVSRWDHKTGFLYKEKEGDYVLNLKPSRDLHPIKVKNTLFNVNNRRRSDVHRLTCGERWHFSNWGSKGYSYCLNLTRENIWDGEIFITGSWSPDMK